MKEPLTKEEREKMRGQVARMMEELDWMHFRGGGRLMTIVSAMQGLAILAREELEADG